LNDRDLDTRSASADPAAWTQRVGGLTRVPRLLSGFGVAAADTLAAAGLPPDALDDPERRWPYLAVARMLTESVRATGCEHFGLLVGREWGLEELGLIGRLMRHSPTLGDALRVGTVMQRLNSDGGTAFLMQQGRSALVGYAVFHPLAERVVPMYDGVMGLIANCMRELCGPGWHPTEVRLPRIVPADETPYRHHFRCPVRFDADHAAVVFPAEELERSLPEANARTLAVLEAAASTRDAVDLVPQLYRSLRLLLLEGSASGDRAAQLFDMHRRTLSRRLRRQGRTFQSILDEVRYEAARHLLGDTQVPIVEISGALGYAEASAFTRAFRRWSGMAPQSWRASRRADA
jgi:AraC-like DNA-binding protein